MSSAYLDKTQRSFVVAHGASESADPGEGVGA